MRYYAVFDTNVLISALLTRQPDAATTRVVNAIADGIVIPLYNQDILMEYDDVLHRRKFPFSETRIQNLMAMIRQFGLMVDPLPTGEILVDMDDLVFYKVVMAKRDDDARLITGNLRHFPPREFIVTPAEMMSIIESSEF